MQLAVFCVTRSCDGRDAWDNSDLSGVRTRGTSPAPTPRSVTLGRMGFVYGTARAELMVGSLVGAGARPTLIGPVHATIGSAAGGRRNALCGAWVTHDDDVPWPPDPRELGALCPTCDELSYW